MTMRIEYRPTLEQHWVVVNDPDGSEHLEARWVVVGEIQKPSTSAA